MKNILLFVVLLLVAFFVYKKSTPIELDSKVSMLIMQNSKPIRTIRDAQAIESKKSIYIDRIEFKNSNHLKHYKLGSIRPYTQNLFIRFSSDLELKEDKELYFYVNSDDGFALSVDDKEVCSFEKDRAMESTRCEALLKKGSRKVEILYFQGGGNMGIEVRYRIKGENRAYFFGEDSPNIRFEAN